ncbi:hypothetical protein RMATCC62417_06279 [Rhizopus microsporus]|nr:hypothetical protein RMATCC62417_06279 [Rhizopus microsporus]
MSKSNNAVNNIVSDLMRAAAGAGARNVSDEDIDKYVADLILKEAEEKRKKYQEVGIQAYQPVTRKPRPNTRFLLNVVKATDSHNQAVLRANERNINKLRKDRLKREEETRRSHDDNDNTHKRKRSGSSDDSDDDRTSKKSKRKDSSRERLPEKKEKIKYRGRGKVRIERPSMDKYFSSEYDPLLDGDDDDNKYMTANEYRKKHKKKKKKHDQ